MTSFHNWIKTKCLRNWKKYLTMRENLTLTTGHWCLGRNCHRTVDRNITSVRFWLMQCELTFGIHDFRNHDRRISVLTIRQTDGRHDGRTNGWTDGRADGRKNGWTNGRMDERTDGRMDKDWGTNRRTFGRTDGRMMFGQCPSSPPHAEGGEWNSVFYNKLHTAGV